MNNANIRLVDTTILMIFLSLMRHRKATIVARELGMTQPAISHSLKRLRAVYRDPLFLRKSHGLEPTAVARDLEPRIRRIVRLVAETLDEPQEFDLERAEILFRVAAFDYELATILPQLVANLANSNRNVRIVGLPLSSDNALRALADGTIDIALGFFELSPNLRAASTFISEELYTENYVLVARRGHPIFSGSLSLRKFADADHVLVSPFGLVKGMVDQVLQSKGFQRNVQSAVPSLFPALAIIERSDLVASLPSRVAEQNAKRFNLEFAPLPIEGGAFSIRAVRHARDAQSRVHEWVIELLRSCCLPGTPVRKSAA